MLSICLTQTVWVFLHAAVRKRAAPVIRLSVVYKSMEDPLMTVQTVFCGTGVAILDVSHIRFHEWASVSNEGCVKSEKSRLLAGEGLGCGWIFLFGGRLTSCSVSCKLTVSVRKEDVRPQGEVWKGTVSFKKSEGSRLKSEAQALFNRFALLKTRNCEIQPNCI